MTVMREQVNVRDGWVRGRPGVAWRDLVRMGRGEVVWEFLLSVPWLAGGWFCYQRGWWWAGMAGSFFFFF